MNSKLKMYLEITIGVILICCAFYFFFLPSTLVTGGVMGISIIIQDYFGIDPSLFLYFSNGALLIVGFIFLGKNFFVKTIYASLLTPTFIMLLENVADSYWFIQHIEYNPFLVTAVVGSLITAIGLGLCFKNGATTGGMDVVQKILVKYVKIPYSKTMYFTDFVVIVLGGVIFVPKIGFNVERVLFGFMAVVVVGYVVDYIAMNAKPRRTAYIVTTKPNEIKELIYKKIHRGVTLVDVKGGFSLEEKSMIICTLEKREWYKINDLLNQVDEQVFAFISATKEVGGLYGSGKKNSKESTKD